MELRYGDESELPHCHQHVSVLRLVSTSQGKSPEISINRNDLSRTISDKFEGKEIISYLGI